MNSQEAFELLVEIEDHFQQEGERAQQDAKTYCQCDGVEWYYKDASMYFSVAQSLREAIRELE